MTNTWAELMGAVIHEELVGLSRAEIIETLDLIQEELDRMRAQALACDAGELYLPGLEPSVARYFSPWSRN